VTPPATSLAAGVAGLAAGLLFFGGFGLLFTPPSPNSPADEVLRYLVDYRPRIFVATCLLGLGFIAFVWFVVALRTFLADHGETTLSTAAALGALAGTIIVMTSFAVLAGVVLHVDAKTNAPMAALAFDTYNALLTVAGFGFALGIGAAAWSSASSGALPAGYQRTGLLIALLQLATIPGLFVQSGFLAAGGPMALIAFGALGAWYVAIAIRFLRAEHLTAARPGSSQPNLASL
jgi:hypothetical protein